MMKAEISILNDYSNVINDLMNFFNEYGVSFDYIDYDYEDTDLYGYSEFSIDLDSTNTKCRIDELFTMTDTDKTLDLYRIDGSYNIPHEALYYVSIGFIYNKTYNEIEDLLD